MSMSCARWTLSWCLFFFLFGLKNNKRAHQWVSRLSYANTALFLSHPPFKPSFFFWMGSMTDNHSAVSFFKCYILKFSQFLSPSALSFRGSFGEIPWIGPTCYHHYCPSIVYFLPSIASSFLLHFFFLLFLPIIETPACLHESKKMSAVLRNRAHSRRLL